MIRRIFLLPFLIWALNAKAQDAEFSQFYANPVYLNPAFAGTTVFPKIHLNFRDQWPEMNHAYVTYSASYDQYIPFLHGGIGVQFFGDRAGGGIYNTIGANLMYNYRVNLSETWAMHMGLQGSYMSKQLDYSKILLFDQIDPISGFYNNGIVNSTTEILPIDPNISILDFSAGLLVFNETFFGGFAVKHLTEPEENYTGSSDGVLPRRYTVHGGAVLNISNKSDGYATFSPNFMYTTQANFRQLNIGSYLKYGFIFGGLWYRHNISHADAVILLAGLQYGIFKFGYSYDLTISQLKGNSGGAHEISVILNFDDLDNVEVRQKRDNILKCPSLF